MKGRKGSKRAEEKVKEKVGERLKRGVKETN
jgi:hypothetical protein